MTFCSACGMRRVEAAVHLCTLEVLMALGVRGAAVPEDARPSPNQAS